MTMVLDSMILGLLVGASTGCIALLALRWAYAKGNQTFMMAFMGGIVVRLLIVAVASFVILSSTDTHPHSYIISMLVAYLFFLGLEVYYAIVKNASHKRADSENLKK